MNAGLASSAINIDAGAGVRTDDLIKILDDGSGNVDTLAITASNTGSGSVLDLNVTGVRTGNILDIAMDAAATANVIAIDMNLALAATALMIDAGGGLRTQPLIETIFDGTGTTIGGTLWDIDVTNTGAAASPLFDIDVTAVYTGNIIDIVFGNASASTGDALHIDMGTNLAGNAIQIDAAGARTAPLINIVNTGTDGGTDDHVILISQTGVLDSNIIDITYSAGASTGNALSLAMGTNVEGMAIDINSAATGVFTEGACIDIQHTGNLVDGANVFRLRSNGSPAAANGHIVKIMQDTGAGVAGNYALYVSALGANVEGLKVDDGAVVFDETLLVSGAAKFTIGAQTSATALTATNDGLTTGIIPPGTGFVTAAAGGSANNIITLPVPVVGNVIYIQTDATGCELRTVAASNVTINNVDSDGGANECALVASSTFTCICTLATGWIIYGRTNVGATIAPIVPDAV